MHAHDGKAAFTKTILCVADDLPDEALLDEELKIRQIACLQQGCIRRVSNVIKACNMRFI